MLNLSKAQKLQAVHSWYGQAVHSPYLWSYPALCDLMDCSLPRSSVRGILQARILEWVAIPFSRGSSWPRDQTWVSCIASKFFKTYKWGNTREVGLYTWYMVYLIYALTSFKDQRCASVGQESSNWHVLWCLTLRPQLQGYVMFRGRLMMLPLSLLFNRWCAVLKIPIIERFRVI